MLFDKHPDEEFLKIRIEFLELCDLKAVRRDRRKLLHYAFEFGLTCDLVRSFLGLDEAEIDMWYNDWIENRRFCYDD